MSSASEATPDRSRSPSRVTGTAGAWVYILLLFEFFVLIVFGCFWLTKNISLSCPQNCPAGRCDLESSDSSDSTEDEDESKSDDSDEYEEEYSYDSLESDSGGSVTKELNPLETARSQL